MSYSTCTMRARLLRPVKATVVWLVVVGLVLTLLVVIVVIVVIVVKYNTKTTVGCERRPDHESLDSRGSGVLG